MTTYAVVGNGIAGLSAAEEIRRNDPSGEIFLFGDEGVPTYERIFLKLYLKDKKTREQLFLKPPAWYADKRITFIPKAVAKVLPSERKLLYEGGELAYDKLILATGATPNDLPVPGRSLRNIRFLYDLADAEDAVAGRGGPHRVVVVGGGVLALETADCYRHLGAEVTLVVKEDRFNPRFMDAVVNQLAIERFVAEGVRIVFDDQAAEFLGDAGGSVAQVRTQKGRLLDADAVRLAVGAHSELGLIGGSGIEADKSVFVNERMETNLPNIWAAGDVAAPQNPATGERDYVKLWAPAGDMGKVAGHNASCPGPIAYHHGAPIGFTFLFDLIYYWIGAIEPVKTGGEFIVHSRFLNDGQHFEKLVFKDRKLVGVCLWGGRPVIYTLKRLIDSQLPVADLGGQMLQDGFDWKALSKRIPGGHPTMQCPLHAQQAVRALVAPLATQGT